MRKFNKWIEALEVEDIPCVRRQFTWYRPNGEAKSKLGRVFVSDWKVFTKIPRRLGS